MVARPLTLANGRQRLTTALRHGWRRACWVAAPRPSGRQVAGLLLLALVLSPGLLRVLLRPYPPLTEMGAWDDYHLLTQLDRDHSVAAALGYFHGDWPERNGFYRPLTGLSLWLDYHLWHWQPYGYRLTSALLYVVSGAALTLLLALLSGRREYAVAGLVCFLWLPQQGSQAVMSYLNERGDLLCGLFALLALYCALRFVVDAGGRWLSAASALLVGALLAKEMGLALPLLLAACALPLLAGQPAGRPGRLARTLLACALWSLLVLGWVCLYHHFVGVRMPLPGDRLPRALPNTRVLVAGAIFPDLVILWSALVGHVGVEDLFSPVMHLMAGRLLLWLAALIWLARRQPWLLVVYLLWTPLAWIPLRTTHVSSDHYFYLPQLNRYLALGVLAVLAWRALAARRRAR